MIIHTERKRPSPWSYYRAQAKHPALVPFHWLEWFCRWLAYWLSGWALLEVLEYVGTLSILIAVISYFAESDLRTRQRHYQAWQVINTSQGKGGAGGRIEALEELNKDGVSLVGLDVSDAFLQRVNLDGAELTRANFSSADVREGSFVGAQMEFANLTSGNFRNASFRRVVLRNATLQDADLQAVNLSDADLAGADLSKADLRFSDLHNAKWSQIADLKLANIFGAKNVPPDFNSWAKQKGAVSIESDDEWSKLLEPQGGGEK
jgi:Pentapeptide repeats (8 copies)